MNYGEPTLWQALVQLFSALWMLFLLLASFAGHWILLISWAAWWLGGVNWNRLWPVLARGAWAPLLLLSLLVALVWSRVAPAPCDCLGVVTVPNFWWQLGEVGLFVASALFCGWLQGLLHWAPADINLEPPAPSHDHGHAAHH